MGMDDLAMDMETLHRILKSLKVPQERLNDYQWLLENLESHSNNHPDCESALKLVKIIMGRLK